MPNEAKFKLTDLDLSTVGIVSRGAVSLDEDTEPGRNFFIFKKEAGMPDEENVTVEQTATDKGILAKVIALLTTRKAEGDGVSKPDPEAILEAAQILQDGGYPISAEDLGNALMPGNNANEEDQQPETPSPDSSPMMTGPTQMSQESAGEALKAVTAAQIEQLQKGYDTQLAKMEQAFEAKYGKLISDLQGEVKKSNERYEAERVAKAKQQMVSEAGAYWMLPQNQSELGDLLFKASEGLDEEAFGQLTGLLKAVDNQLGAAGIFGELGTSEMSEAEATIDAKLEKAEADGVTPEEALMKLDAGDQARLLEERRQRIKGKGGKH